MKPVAGKPPPIMGLPSRALAWDTSILSLLLLQIPEHD